MKLIKTLVVSLLFLSGAQFQDCGMYLEKCCDSQECNRGFVCLNISDSAHVCYTPQCTNTQECMQYAFWTDCNVQNNNCNACGFIGQRECSIQIDGIQRNKKCYQGCPQNGYCQSCTNQPPPMIYAPPPPQYENIQTPCSDQKNTQEIYQHQ